MKHTLYIYLRPFIGILICFVFTFSLQAQDEIPGCPVLQDIDGRAQSLQEGKDGSYYIIYSASYENGIQNDTIFINTPDNYLVLNEGTIADSIPKRRYKVVKFNSDDEIVASQDIYSYIDAGIGHMRVDNESIIIEVRGVKDLHVGDEHFPYFPEENNFTQFFVMLDDEDLSFQNHLTVNSDRNIELENWDVNDGSIYVMNEASHYVSVNGDTTSVEHPGFTRQWINMIRYDYENSELLWSKLLLYGLSETGLVFPFHTGVDIGNDGLIYTSGGDYGVPTYLLGDTLNQVVNGEWIDPVFLDGVIMVINPEGGFIDYYEGEGNNLYIVDVKTIGDYAYLLMHGNGQTFNYKGKEIELNLPDSYFNANVLIKVDKEGEYVTHWQTNTDCRARYNYMRISSQDELILFGKYTTPDQGCSNTTSEGLPFIGDQMSNGSILTLNKDLDVIENILFSADLNSTIPLDKRISNHATLLSYDSHKVLTKTELLNTLKDNVSDVYSNHFLVTPNPTYGIFNVSQTKIPKEVLNAEIYSLDGRLVNKLQIGGNVSVDISHYQSGTYFIKLLTETHITIKKIIKL